MTLKEKKVEYIELIYDLIFVYIVGRNNELLHTLKNGFTDPSAALVYVITSFIVLQIWYYTTLFINRYGENDKVMHIGIFINMYLLYYMAQGVRVNWQEYYVSYNIAWALIILNIAVMYYIRLKRGDPAKVWENLQIKRNIAVLLVQAGIILISLPIYRYTSISVSPFAMLFGIIAAIAGNKVNALAPVEFNHLTERVMLYVVFTFGEMIIAISGYFNGGTLYSTVYFSLFAFLIVTGLFMSYGVLYDYIINKDITTNGTGYMMIHVFLILLLNNMTAALEFMRKPEVDLLAKNIFLTFSLIGYSVIIYIIAKICRPGKKTGKRINLEFLIGAVLFAALMMMTYKNAYISIVVTMGYVGYVYLTLIQYKKEVMCEK